MQRFSLYGVHKRDYQESVTIGQTDARTHTQTDAGQSDPYVPLCFAGDTYYSLSISVQLINQHVLYIVSTFFTSSSLHQQKNAVLDEYLLLSQVLTRATRPPAR